MKLIVAVDQQWGIGKDRDLLLSIPDDMRFFRETTRNAVLVMGYNTLLSFPNSKPLPGRLNIVLADIEGCRVDGAVVCGSMQQLLALLTSFNSDEVFVIGGGMMYRQLLPYCDTAYITKMQFDGAADTFIPNLDMSPSWRIIDESEEREHEGIRYSFVTYHNAAPIDIAFAAQAPATAPYFMKKADVTFALLDRDDEDYRAELKRLLSAYFKPLAGGLHAKALADFDAQEETFTAYLKRRGCIADAADIAALEEHYDPEHRCTSYPVCITKENAAAFAEKIDTETMKKLSEEFGC